MGKIVLSISGLILEIEKFSTPEIPRGRVEPLGKIEYTIPGATVIEGPAFDPKYLWSVNCLLEPEKVRILEAIFSESDYWRRKLSPNLAITLVDKTRRITEKELTRTIASGTVPLQVGPCVSYYGQFECFMVQPPKIEEKGIYDQCAFTLQEL